MCFSRRVKEKTQEWEVGGEMIVQYTQRTYANVRHRLCLHITLWLCDIDRQQPLLRADIQLDPAGGFAGAAPAAVAMAVMPAVVMAVRRRLRRRLSEGRRRGRVREPCFRSLVLHLLR